MRRQFADELSYNYENMRDADICHEFELNQLNRLVEYLRTVESPHSGALSREILQRDFKNFYQQYDQRRGKNFKDTFPQFAEWYDSL
jgi:hypothetical protein